MSYQSTNQITREDAETRVIESLNRVNREQLEILAKTLSNKELEDLIETDFDNYTIED